MALGDFTVTGLHGGYSGQRDGMASSKEHALPWNAWHGQGTL